MTLVLNGSSTSFIHTDVSGELLTSVLSCLVHGHKTQLMAAADLLAESLKEVKLKVMN